MATAATAVVFCLFADKQEPTHYSSFVERESCRPTGITRGDHDHDETGGTAGSGSCRRTGDRLAERPTNRMTTI
ncbi:hypothetical protein quinque_011607 [Culex quinquefasciatus]